VLFDGWPLIHNPLGAAAWHLRTLLALNPEGVQAIIALPTEAGAISLNEGIESMEHHTHDRGAWEQKILPQLAEEKQASLIHTTSLGASLLGKVATLVSPAETDASDRGRLNEALAFGGLAKATILWPQDMPVAKMPGQIRTLPPIVHPDFASSDTSTPQVKDLPDDFLLVQGVFDGENVLRLLESWTWAAASIGELYPLVFIGLDEPTRKFLEARIPEFHLQESVRILQDIPAQETPGLFRACAAVVYVGKPAPWGNALRSSMACGKALVAIQQTETESIVGSAAYLVAANDLRGFGAAMITVVVDEKAREKLEDSSREHAAHWSPAKFKEELMKIYSEKI
jgi:glycosyltransferase involved in cell wall biosynthesis